MPKYEHYVSRDEIYAEAEHWYYNAICSINKPGAVGSREDFIASLNIKNPDKLASFHRWLTRNKQREIKSHLLSKKYGRPITVPQRSYY